MHVTSNLRAASEYVSFSNFTKSNATFSIFSRRYFGVTFTMTNRSKPFLGEEKRFCCCFCFALNEARVATYMQNAEILLQNGSPFENIVRRYD